MKDILKEYEKEKHKRKTSKLECKYGEKIRWQYFNAYIYMMISYIPAVPAMIIAMELRKGNIEIWNCFVEMAEAIPVCLGIYGIFIGPFIILSIFNRFCFGKILGVVNESMLFLENQEIPINVIKEIVYHPRPMTRRKNSSCCYATVVVQSENNDTKSIDVAHFPLYGLRKIKKYNPNIKLSCDKYVWFLILCPTVIFVVLGLVSER